MVAVLATGLTGANWSFQAAPLGDDLGGPPRLGQSFIAIGPAAMAPGFADRLEVMLTATLTQEGVRLPGARRQANAAGSAEEGVAISEAERRELAALTGGPI